MIPAIIAVLGVYIASNTYIAIKLWRWLEIGSRAAAWAWSIGFALLAGGFFIGMTKFLPAALNHVLTVLGGYYMAAYVFLVAAIPVTSLIVRGRGGRATALILIAAALAYTLYGAWNARHVRLEEYRVKGKDMPPMTIAMVSDIHLGEQIGADEVERIVGRINECDADIVFMVGDVFDSGPSRLRDIGRVGELISSIKSRKGVYAVIGNHDGGFRGEEDLAEEYLESWGVTVLRDEVANVDNIDIIGRRDRMEQRLDIAQLMEQTNKGNHTIVLDHQPGDLEAICRAGADMVLCGHTHRGQIFPGCLVTDAMFKVDYGMDEDNGCTMIVSSGAGTWGPRVRTGSQSEVVKIIIE
ncbi:MAG: metallophosphoesterase [Clostridia bacterium]|nr:metallophosphoesterase [Clostridia bacterium]